MRIIFGLIVLLVLVVIIWAWWPLIEAAMNR